MITKNMMSKGQRKFQRKGQVTSFITVGVILIIMVGIYFFIKGEILEEVEPEKIVPPDFVEVNDYIESCMQDISEEAIRIVGQNGGYIEIPAQVKADYYSYVKPIPGGVFSVPLWFYKSQDRIPTITMIENNIATYVEGNMDSCIADFVPLENTYDISQGERQIKVIISEDDVKVNMFQPILAKRLDKNQFLEFSEFTIKHDVKLKDAYDTAVAITEDQEKSSFLEKTFIDLMVLDEEIPFSDMTLDCDRKRWSKSVVSSRIKDLISANLPRIRFKGTDFIPFQSFETYEKLHMFWDVEDMPESAEDLLIKMQYEPRWFTDINIMPSEGDELRSNKGQGLMQYMDLLCLNIYHFTYDLELPIVITTVDQDSFNGEGYEFSFAVPVYIDHNAPERESYGSRDYRAPVYDSDFCSERSGVDYTFRAVDHRTGFDIEGVNFTFECVTNYCDLGMTDIMQGSFKLVSNFPEHCTGGFVVADHPNYERAELSVSLEELSPDDVIELRMREKKSFEYEVYRHRLDNMLIRMSVPDDQIATISITDNVTDETVFRMYPTVANQTLDLLYDDVTYNIELMLLDKGSDNILGGFKYDWNVSYDELADADKIIFHVIEQFPHPESEEEQQQLMIYIENATLPDMLKPELVIG